MSRARRLALLVAGAALVLPALTAAPAAQAAPGNGNGKKPGVTGTIMLVYPSTIQVNESFTTSGSGFTPSSVVLVAWHLGTASYGEAAYVDAQGKFTKVLGVGGVPGSYRVDVTSGKRVLASSMLTVTL